MCHPGENKILNFLVNCFCRESVSFMLDLYLLALKRKYLQYFTSSNSGGSILRHFKVKRHIKRLCSLLKFDPRKKVTKLMQDI